MIKKSYFYIVLSAFVVLFACFVWSLFSGNEASRTKSSDVLIARRRGNVKSVTKISLEGNDKKAVKIVNIEERRPNLLDVVKNSEDDATEEELTETQKTVLNELQAALDNNDLKGVRRALLKFSNCVSKNGPNDSGYGRYAALPRSMREAAVSALGWFGSEAATDLLDFMVDPDEGICEDAWSKFEQALSDFNMGDLERANILVTMSKAVTDSDRLDSLYMEFMNVRNSYKADALIKILETGTPQAKAVLQESLEFYTESDVKTVDDIARWKAANPDDSGDEEFYGPKKDE